MCFLNIFHTLGIIYILGMTAELHKTIPWMYILASCIVYNAILLSMHYDKQYLILLITMLIALLIVGVAVVSLSYRDALLYYVMFGYISMTFVSIYVLIDLTFRVPITENRVPFVNDMSGI